MIANVNRDSRARREPFEALDFIAWNDHHRAAPDAEPVLLDDPDEQAKMIDRVLFGRRDG